MFARRPLGARASTQPIIIVLMRQSSLSWEGSPAHHLHIAMLPYFQGEARGNLWFLDAPFDVVNDMDTAHYRTSLDAALANVTK